MPDLVTLETDRRWRIGATEFVYSYEPDSAVDRFAIRKPASLVDKYVQLSREFHHCTFVELGIAAGGSTAFLALLAEPEKLVAFELASEPITALADLIDREQLTESIRPHYGVDQSDRALLHEILDREFGDATIDIVVDDASHLYDETKASFEVLMPRVRPGGLFIIEDWAADYMRYGWVTSAINDPTSENAAKLEKRIGEVMESRARGLGPFPLHRIAAELMQICFHRPDVVAEVTVDPHWITVRKGDADLDNDAFRMADYHKGNWQWVLP